MKPNHPPLYLQACHQRDFSGCDEKTLRVSLKDHGIDGKRLSRFSLMSLLVAMPLAGQIGADCSIILAAPFSSPRRFLPTFLQHAQDGTPSPLGFAASLHNAPAFQLAQALGSCAGMIFLATDEHNFWQPLWLGINDLLAGSAKQCCINWLYETPNPAANEAALCRHHTHRHRCRPLHARFVCHRKRNLSRPAVTLGRRFIRR